MIATWTMLYNEPQNVSRGDRDRVRKFFELLFEDDVSPPEHLHFTPMHQICVISSENNQGIELAYSDLDQGDITERTALSWVAQQGKQDLLYKLLRCKADPNKRDFSGKSALHWSVAAKNSPCVQGLIDYGADVFAKDKLGSTPIHIAVQSEGDLNTVQTLLSFGADLRERDGQGMMPLHLAAHYDRPSIVSRLITNGASINVTEYTGRTALHIAISLNNYGVLRLLLSYASLQHHVRDNFERTILHFAACLGDTSTLSIMTAANLKGVFADDKDSSGATAMQYAQWRLLYNEEWSNSVVEPRDADPWAWYTTFRELMMKVRGNMADEAFKQSAHGYPYTWESLNNDLATLTMSGEEVTLEDPDSEDEWEDASEVPLDERTSRAALSTTESIDAEAGHKVVRSADTFT